jgi:hypothetical protein
MLKVSSTSSIVSAVVGTDYRSSGFSRNSYYHVSSRAALPALPFVRTKYTKYLLRRVALLKSNTTSSSVAEAGVIVATVGALLSIIVPVAETVPLAMLKVSSLHVNVVGTVPFQ